LLAAGLPLNELVSEFGVADLMEAFAGLPRDLNFIQHTSHLGWKM